MQRKDSDQTFCFLLPPVTEPSRAFRRSNLIAIAILVFFSIGLLLIGLVPAPPTASGPALATGHSQPRIGSAPRAHHIR